MFQVGAIHETSNGKTIQIIKNLDNPAYTQVVYCEDLKRKKVAIFSTNIERLISSPLPLIGDRVIDTDGEEGTVVNSSAKCLTIKKKDVITSHSFEKKLPKIKQLSIEKSSRGGSRVGAGRPPTGNPPKKRKAIQLDQDLADTLPNLKMLADLIQEFRPFGESSALRCTKLAEFYKALDQLPRI